MANLRGSSWLILVCIVSLLMSVGVVAAQDSSGTLYLKILDSTSGAGIKPSRITVDDKAIKFDVEAGSLIALSLSNGSHQLMVSADGYNPMTLTAAVSGENTPVTEIELDATNPTAAPPVDADAAVLEGAITDSDTGALISGAVLTIPGASMTTTTDSSGKYEFDLVVGKSLDSARPAITLEIKAEGYTPRRMTNVALAPGERRNMPVRLDRLTSDTASAEIMETDENAAPGSFTSSEWTYDVTIR